MPRGVAGRRDDPDPVDHVGLAAVQLVRRAFEVVELGDRVVLVTVRGVELGLLGEDRRPANRGLLPLWSMWKWQFTTARTSPTEAPADASPASSERRTGR